MTNIKTNGQTRLASARHLRLTIFGLAGAGALALALSAGAHENWRKVRDALPGVTAPMNAADRPLASAARALCNAANHCSIVEQIASPTLDPSCTGLSTSGSAIGGMF